MKEGGLVKSLLHLLDRKTLRPGLRGQVKQAIKQPLIEGKRLTKALLCLRVFLYVERCCDQMVPFPRSPHLEDRHRAGSSDRADVPRDVQSKRVHVQVGDQLVVQVADLFIIITFRDIFVANFSIIIVFFCFLSPFFVIITFYIFFGGPGRVAARKSHKLRSSGSPSEEDRAWGNS